MVIDPVAVVAAPVMVMIDPVTESVPADDVVKPGLPGVVEGAGQPLGTVKLSCPAVRDSPAGAV